MYKYQMQKKVYLNGIWTIDYKRWEEDGCYCSATKHTIQISKTGNPVKQDLIDYESKNPII